MSVALRPVDPDGAAEAATSGEPVAGAVSTAFPIATEAGFEILQAGGNAIDAAAAAAWTLCVCEPSASGLGGQTIMLIRFPDGRARVIDGHSFAPAAASMDRIGRSEQRRGRRASTVPSTVATLHYAQQKYGRLRWDDVMSPAIRVAEEGYVMTHLQHRQVRWVADMLDPSAAPFLLPDGAPPPAGHILRQPALAATLRRLARCGAADFYRGEIARLIAGDMERYGGLITLQDLADSDVPREHDPIGGHYRGHHVVTAPPPAGGCQLLLALMVLEQLAPDGFAGLNQEWRENIALTTSAVFEKRERLLLAPTDGGPPPLNRLLETDCARRIATELARNTSVLPGSRWGAEEPGDTTHLSVCDRYGNVVLLTQSIQSVFGAKVAHPTLGFLYNNYLCTCLRRPRPDGLRGRVQPRSNAAPTLVTRGPGSAAPLLALGAAGSRRIISSILQVTSGVIDGGLDLAAAVAAPRVHGLLGLKVWIERPAACDGLLARLEARGRRPIIKSQHSYAMGAVQALHFTVDDGVHAAADPRRDGTAIALTQT